MPQSLSRELAPSVAPSVPLSTRRPVPPTPAERPYADSYADVGCPDVVPDDVADVRTTAAPLAPEPAELLAALGAAEIAALFLSLADHAHTLGLLREAQARGAIALPPSLVERLAGTQLPSFLAPGVPA